MSTASPTLWCRVEEEGGRVWRVHVMHPNGEILLSYPPEHFPEALVRRIQAGQVRAMLVEGEAGGTTLRIEDESGGLLHCETAAPVTQADPQDATDR